MERPSRRTPNRPPALILCAEIAGLALARRLGRKGIPVALFDTNPHAAAWSSRYCQYAHLCPPSDDAHLLIELESVAAILNEPAALLATSDEFLLFISRNRHRLQKNFRLLLPAAQLLDDLLDKRRMAQRLAEYGVPTPRSLTIEDPLDLRPAAADLGFPCLLKSAYSKIAGCAEAGKVPVRSWTELEAAYRQIARFDSRVMVQEYLEGDCTHVALYNAYFNRHSQPVAIFTGRKLRQYPADFGTACRSECGPHPEIAAPLTRFFTEVGYRGPVDVGLKWDRRAGIFKVLDINPRLGQNYRTYVAADGADLGWLAYRELAGEELPPNPLLSNPPRPRLWAIEDNDWRSVRQMSPRRRLAWIASLLRVDEFAYWDWRDPQPFLQRLRRPPLRPTPQPAPAATVSERSGETYARVSR